MVKALYIYSKHAKKDRELLKRVEDEMHTYVTSVDVSEAPQELRNLIRATPALIFAPDYLQGQELTQDGVDGEILLLAEIYKNLEQDELLIHYQETQRLDNFVNAEKINGQENMLMEMIIEGRI